MTIFPVGSEKPVEAMFARRYSREYAVSRVESHLLQEDGFHASSGVGARGVLTGRMTLIGKPATL